MRIDQKKTIRTNKTILILFFIFFFLIQGCYINKPDKLFKSAIDLWTESKYIEAVKTFETILDLYPDHCLAPKANFWIGDIYYIYLGDTMQAIFEYRRVVKNYPKSEFAPTAQWKIASLIARYPSDRDQCIKEYQTFIKLFPKHALTPNAQYNLAEAYLDMGHYEQAITEFEIFIEKHTVSDLMPLALQRLGELYNIFRMFPRAIQLLNMAYELSKEDDARLIIRKTLADSYVSQGEISKGLEIYEDILEAEPDNENVKHRIESLNERKKIMDTKQRYKW